VTPRGSSMEKIPCPDGTIRLVLKNPEKAFAIAFPEWQGRIGAIVRFIGGTQGEANGSLSKRTESIVKELTEKYAALQAHYQNAYLGWCSNPCSIEAEKDYSDARKLILKKEMTLQEIEKNARIGAKMAYEDPFISKKNGGQARYRMRKSDHDNESASEQDICYMEHITSMANLDKIEKLVRKLEIS
jgi:hypothetical protein